ncbi:MAG: DEAD/DEAH box helicase family protein, partial [Candidatus Pacearchaeota archaeon]
MSELLEVDLIAEESSESSESSELSEDSSTDSKGRKVKKKAKKKDKKSDSKINYVLTGDKELYLTKTGLFIKYSDLASSTEIAIKKVRKIDNRFSVKYKLITGHIKTVKAITVNHDKQRIIIPRFSVYEIADFLPNHYVENQIPEGLDVNFKWIGKLNSNQEIITNYIMSHDYSDERVESGSAGLILNLEAGQGKSYVAANLITRVKKKTAVIMHSTSLLAQWAKVLEACIESPRIGYYYGEKKTAGDIVLMIIDSASHDEMTIKEKIVDGKIVTCNEKVSCIEFYKSFGFIIYDECHLYANKQGVTTFKRAQATYMLGLSATPDENVHGLDKLVNWSLGPILTAKNIKGYQ